MERDRRREFPWERDSRREPERYRREIKGTAGPMRERDMRERERDRRRKRDRRRE